MALIQRAAAETPGSATVSCQFTTANITAGNLIAVYVNWASATTTPVSLIDSAGNLYQLGKLQQGNTLSCAWYFAPITAGGGTQPTVTLTLSAVDAGPEIVIYEFSGYPNATLDQAVGATGTLANPASGSFTSTAATELFL